MARYTRRRSTSYRHVERTTDPRKLAGMVQGMWAFWTGQSSVGMSIDALLAGTVAEAPPKLPGFDEGTELAAVLRDIVKRGQAPSSAANQFGYLVGGGTATAMDVVSSGVDALTGTQIGTETEATVDSYLAELGWA